MIVQRRVIITAILLIASGAVIGGLFLWEVLATYIQPNTPTERKELVNVFVAIATAVGGSLTAMIAVGNYYISSRNLEQQRELDARRAQDTALQTYNEQMGKMLTEQGLRTSEVNDDIRLLAKAQTVTTLREIDPNRKVQLLLFLECALLIHRDDSLVNLVRADLRFVDLSKQVLSEADLSYADLSYAYLRDTDLSGSVLEGTRLIGADLRDADLHYAEVGAYLMDANLTNANLAGANLTGATGVTPEQVHTVRSLDKVTMPNGQKYEEWLKDKEGKHADNADTT